MDANEFERWLAAMSSLNIEQRRQALQLLAPSAEAEINRGQVCREASLGRVTSNDEPAVTPGAAMAAPQRLTEAEAIAELGQRRVEITGCPHCDCRDVVIWGNASGLTRYRCKACRRTFNALTKTPLARLRKKEKWSAQAEALIEGVSVSKAAARCDVHYTTAFRWRHRFLSSLSADKPTSLTGIVESDETFVLESFKGKRSNLPRPARKRGGKSSKRGLSLEQIPVIVARDRAGATTDAVLPRLNRVSITAALGGVVSPANEFCCDGGTAIIAFARQAGIPTHILPVPGKPNPQAPDFHINNVNAYHGRLKEWMRRFHGVATKNLPNYLGWRRTLEAFGSGATTSRLILGAIGLGPYQQLTQ